MTKKIYFLSGLPRSGSTLLGAILSQNPDIHVTPTSPLLDLMCYTDEALQKIKLTYTYDEKALTDNVYCGIINSFYKNIEKPIVIDKHRGWPRNLIPVKKYIDENAKIICTYRPISEIITSYIVLINKNPQKNNFIDDSLKKRNMAITTENRARILWDTYISDPYQSTLHGLKNYRQHIFFVSYDDLHTNKYGTIEKIYKFLDLPVFNQHNFEDIHNYCAEEKDAAWGVEGLHDIRKSLKKISINPKEILGNYLVDFYNQYNLEV